MSQASPPLQRLDDTGGENGRQSTTPDSGEVSQKEVVNPTINAKESYSRSHYLELYYGSCSNFSFLQHLHNSLPTGQADVADTESLQKLDLYKHRQLFFGPSPTPELAQRRTEAVNGRLTYLQVGAATRMAFASGLHRDVDYPSPDRYQEQRKQERRRTFWCLAFWECWTAFASGRPNSLNKEEILCPYPTDQKLVQMLGRLAMIMLKAKASIYGQDSLSVLGLWRAAQTLHAEYLDFSNETRWILGFDISGAMPHNGSDIKQVYLTAFYQHSLMLTFKPFLIVHVLMQKPVAANFPRSSQMRHSASPDQAWISEACSRATDAATRMLFFFFHAIDSNPMVKTQSYIAWHIEYACFVLFQDIIRNPHYLQAHLLPIDSALTCLSKFSDARIAPRVKHTIEKLRAKILDLVAQPKGTTTAVATEQEAAPETQDPLLYAGVQDDLPRSLSFPPQQLMDEDFALLGNVDYEQVFLRTGDYNIGFDAIPAEPFALSNLDASFSLPFLDGNI
ncbi:hypothetical protein BJY04DRAFT_210790 [Aspergillus karnatakaensis]|uniref:fungal specific transcription factor domain-containing protein n=1 Tax=Aspergillus karnatakaensis TaxID=1810916 RepID=UPI003CCD87FC